jgi:hypothetical protein
VARKEAHYLHHPFVGTEHLLLGLLQEHDAIAEQVLETLGVSPEVVRREVADRVGHWDAATKDSLPFTPRAKKVLGMASRIGHGETGTQHLWAAIDLEPEGVAAEVLTDLGISLGSLRAMVLSMFRQGRATGGVSYAPMSRPVGSGVPQLTGFQHFLHRYPGRSLLPIIAWLDYSVPGTRGRFGWLYRPVPGPGKSLTRSTMLARHRAITDLLELDVAVGTEWSASTVVVGRGPEDFAKAYEALEQLAEKLGIKVGDGRIRVDSVRTDQGPGLRLVLVNKLDEPDDRGGGNPG